MFAEEWPLMMFTLISQLAVGIFIVFICINIFTGNKAGDEHVSKATEYGLLIVWPLMGVALIFSLFHLGTPLGAYRAVNNFASSWLSREIVFASLFFFMTIATYYSFKKGKKQKIMGIVTAIVGLLVIYSMASIYGSSIRPAWDNLYTYISFFGATCLLGTISSAVMIAVSLKEKITTEPVLQVLKKIGFFAVVAAVIQIGYLPIYMSNLSHGGAVAQSSLQILSEDYGIVLGLKWILSMIGILLLMYVCFKHAKKAPVFNGSILLIALVTVFAGEFIGRYIFYATAVSIGIG